MGYAPTALKSIMGKMRSNEAFAVPGTEYGIGSLGWARDQLAK